MEKTIKLRSQSLSLLNESLRKLILTDEVKKVLPVIVEADGKFSSIVKADDSFDPATLDSNIEAEDETEENKENKQQLLNKASESLKQTLQNSKELDEILQKIKKLSEEDGYNEWVVNDKGNTASLKSKNARIFRQNNYLCLSHNGKVELFNSVCELRKWLEENNYPLPKNNIEIHESVVVEDKKKANSEKVDDFNWFNLLDDEKRAEIEKAQLARLQNSPKNIQNEINNLRNKQQEFIDNLKKSIDMEKLDKSVKKAIALERDAKATRELDKKGENAAREFLSKFTDETINNIAEIKKQDYFKSFPEYKNLEYKISELTNELKSANKTSNPGISREDQGLGKTISKQDYNYFSKKKAEPTKLKVVRLPDDDMTECFAGVATANLGAAVTYLGNKKQKPKKKAKEEKESLDENFWFTGKMPKSHTRGTQTNEVLSAFGSDNKYNRILNTDHEYKNKEGLQSVLDYINTDYYTKDKASLHRSQADNVFRLVKDALDEIVFPVVSQLDSSATKEEIYNNTSDILKNNEKTEWGSDIVTTDKETLNKLTEYLKSKVPNYNFTTELSSPSLFTVNKNGNLALDYKSGNGPFFKELNLALFGKDNADNIKTQARLNKDKIAIDRIKDLISQLDNSNNFSKEDLMLLKQHNISPDNPKARAILDLFKSQSESKDDRLHITEAADKYPWLSKLMGKRLVEDDSPADFATGSPISSDMDSTGNMNADSATGGDGIDFEAEADAAGFDPAAGGNGFGDVDISVGGGYEPEGEGEDAAMAMPPAPEQKIIDVLVDDDNPTDIKVKVQDQDTKKTEIKDLDEIDV